MSSLLRTGFVPGNPDGRPFDNWHSIDTLNSGLVAPQASPSSASLSVNSVVYHPLMVRETVVVKKLWVACGTTGGGTIHLGLYDVSGTRLVNGSAAHPASATELVIDVTDTTISPGVYYWASLSVTATTDVYAITMSAAISDAYGVWYESGSSLPASATFNTGVGGLYIGGILTNTVVS
jgi:hypothetical protein